MTLPRNEEYEALKAGFNIVLLGPGDDDRAVRDKRRDIRDELVALGFQSARLGEDVIGEDSPFPLHLALLPVIDSIDLILVLDAGPSPLAELSGLSTNDRAKQITQVWCEAQFMERRTAPSDVVRMFSYHIYDPREIVTCTLKEAMVHQTNLIIWSRADSQGLLPRLELPRRGSDSDDIA